LAHRLLSKTEEYALARTIREGDEREAAQAKERLMLHIMRLVIPVASKFQNRGLELDPVGGARAE